MGVVGVVVGVVVVGGVVEAGAIVAGGILSPEQTGADSESNANGQLESIL